MLGNVWLAFIVTFGLSIIWLAFCNSLAKRGIVSSSTSRKIIHIGTGPVFVLCWLLFPDHLLSRYAAAIVPFLITTQFFLVGTGIISDPATVKAMSRTGNKAEILKGPLFYGVIFVLLTIIFWTSSPLGIVALMILCGGDGIADLAGKKFGKNCIQWSMKKTWEGSLGMFLGSVLLSSLVIGIYLLVGVFTVPLFVILGNILVLSLFATIVETLPFEDIDNITVPSVVVLVGYLIFKL